MFVHGRLIDFALKIQIREPGSLTSAILSGNEHMEQNVGYSVMGRLYCMGLTVE